MRRKGLVTKQTLSGVNGMSPKGHKRTSRQVPLPLSWRQV